MTAARVLRPEAVGLPAGMIGIRLSLEPRPLATSPLVLRGGFCIPEADLRGLPRPAPGGIALIVQHDGIPFASLPFHERILFAEDERVTHGGVIGAFHLDVLALFPSRAQRSGRYHLFVSLGSHISNVIEAVVA